MLNLNRGPYAHEYVFNTSTTHAPEAETPEPVQEQATNTTQAPVAEIPNRVKNKQQTAVTNYQKNPKEERTHGEYRAETIYLAAIPLETEIMMGMLSTTVIKDRLKHRMQFPPSVHNDPLCTFKAT